MFQFTFLFTLLFVSAPLQNDVLENISTALGAGSSKELIKYCGDNIELKIDGKSATYSLSQAEVVIKDFFLANPVRGFRYIHQGSSPEGLRYTIGNLQVDQGSYRVVMVIKSTKGTLKIDQLNFSKE